VAAARTAAVIAEHVYEEVKNQAIVALAVEGQSVREIAAEIDVPKSEVGRSLRANRGADGFLGDLAVIAPHGHSDEVRDRIRAAWGHR